MNSRYDRSPILAALVIVLVLAPAVRAQRLQPPVPAPATPSYSFFPPGARAMGMGGAFLAIADDATAAEANPAGLTILTKPEVSAHFRFSALDNEFPNIDVSPQRIETYRDTVMSPSFLSYVLPVGPAALSVYYQQQSRFVSHARFEGILTDVDAAGNPIFLDSQDEERLDLRNDNIGFSGAVELSQMLSVGGSVRFSRLRIQAANGFLLQSVAAPQNVYIGLNDGIDDEAHTVTYNFGLLLNANGKFSGGLTYKRGGEFQLTTTSTVTLCLICNGVPNTAVVTDAATIRIPSAFGGGVAFRPTDRWVVGLDVLRITYSDNSALGSLARFSQGGIVPIADGREVHAGAEYTWLRGDTPIALRFGAFSDPDHDGIVDVDSSQLHATFGAGVVIRERFQLDGAINIAENVQEFLFSMVLRFP